MNWIKRNRAMGGVTALAVIGWIAFCFCSLSGNSDSVTEAASSQQSQKADMDFQQRYGLASNARAQITEQTLEPLRQIRVTFRAVMLERTAPGTSMSDADFAYALERELKKSPLFDSEETALNPAIARDEASGTFSFGAKLVLKQPLKL